MARNINIFDNPYYQQLSSVGQGAMAGAQFGPTGAAIGAVVGGVAGMAGDYLSDRAAINRINPQIGAQQYDAFGRPVYGLGKQVASFDSRNNYGDDLWKKGMILGPGMALVGRQAGKELERKAQEQIGKGITNIRAAQQRYNQANLNYSQGYLARQQYEDQFR